MTCALVSNRGLMCDLCSCFQQRSDVYSMPEEDGGAEQLQDL